MILRAQSICSSSCRGCPVRKQVAPVWVQPRVSMQQGGRFQPLELIWQDLQAEGKPG